MARRATLGEHSLYLTPRIFASLPAACHAIISNYCVEDDRRDRLLFVFAFPAQYDEHFWNLVRMLETRGIPHSVNYCVGGNA